ncbi:MAG: toll/interleukin-1 receptor domain-containing protein, partial [Ferruginibacter sp.]
ILSPASVSSHNVMDEVNFALESGKLVIPVIIAKCIVPFRLRLFQHIDLTENFSEAFENLVSSLNIVKSATTKPGAISVTLINGMETAAGWTLTVDDMDIKTVYGTKYQITNVATGLHKIEVKGVINKETLYASELVNQPPGEITYVTLTLRP